MSEKRTATFRLTPEVRRWLRLESARTDTPQSAIVERAVRREMPEPEVTR